MIGLLAANSTIAKSVIARLQIDARPISLRSAIEGSKGTALDALIVDESALPLPEAARQTLLPCLALRGAVNHIYELRLAR